MKKLILFACFLIFALLGYGQNSFKYPLIIGTNNGTGGYVRLNGATSGSSTIRVNPNAGTGTIFELPFNNGTNNYVLITNGSGVTSWYDPNNYGFRTAIQVGQQFKDSIANGVDLASVAVLKTEFNRVTDSLNNVIDGLNSEIENIWNAIDSIGNYDRRAPAFASAEIGSFADDTLIVLLNATDVHQDSVPPVSAFSLNAGSNEHGIASVDIGRDTIYLALDSAGVYGVVYTLDYTRVIPALQDSTGNITSNWIAKAVTNNISEPQSPPTTLPTFVTTDGYTYGRYEAKAANITMDTEEPTRVLTLADLSGSNHHMTGMYGSIQWSVGPEWDAVNEELEFGASTSSYILSTPSFTSTSQITIYTVVRINNWESDKAIHHDIDPRGFYAALTTTVNDIVSYNGTWAFGCDNASVGQYGVLTARFTGGDNSVLQWNKRTRGIGNNGNLAHTLFSYGGLNGSSANMSIKEIIIRMTSDSDSNMDAIQSYLMSKYNISN